MTPKYYTALICLSLAAVTVVVYLPVRHFDFVNYDDTQYVTENPHVTGGLAAENIFWAFTSPYASNWHPLTWMSHMLDWQLFGNNPGAHHVVNLVLHVVNTCLLFYMLKVMTGAVWPCAFVAAAFALHPLHVESVAWISERKDVLSTMFWFLTVIAYVFYVKKGGAGRYALALVLFALGLMAKPMLVTLPFVLLLLDFWPLDRLSEEAQRHSSLLRREKYKVRSTKEVFSWAQSGAGWRPVRIWPWSGLVVEKVPFFVLSVLSCAITLTVQNAGGAVVRLANIPIWSRLGNAAASYVLYIAKAIWPANLAVFYPWPSGGRQVWQVAGAFVLLLLITAAVVLAGKRRRYLFLGWFWYLVTLVPVIGLVQVGDQAMADRYSYIPLVGLFIAAAWSLRDLASAVRMKPFFAAVFAVLILSAWALTARRQAGVWRDSETLFSHAIEATEDNYLAHFALARPLYEQGRIEESLLHSADAVRIRPAHVQARYGHALGLLKAGKTDQAAEHLAVVCELSPGWVEPLDKLAGVYMQTRRYKEAAEVLERLLDLAIKKGNALMVSDVSNRLAAALRAAEQ